MIPWLIRVEIGEASPINNPPPLPGAMRTSPAGPMVTVPAAPSPMSTKRWPAAASSLTISELRTYPGCIRTDAPFRIRRSLVNVPPGPSATFSLSAAAPTVTVPTMAAWIVPPNALARTPPGTVQEPLTSRPALSVSVFEPERLDGCETVRSPCTVKGSSLSTLRTLTAAAPLSVPDTPPAGMYTSTAAVGSVFLDQFNGSAQLTPSPPPSKTPSGTSKSTLAVVAV